MALKNGDVLSLAVKFHKVIDSPVIQVDLISAQNNTEFEFAYHYFAFNDLGALIGKSGEILLILNSDIMVFLW